MKMAAICMVVALFAAQLVMAMTDEMVCSQLLQAIEDADEFEFEIPVVNPCHPEAKCAACVDGCHGDDISSRPCIFGCLGREDPLLPCFSACKGDNDCELRCTAKERDVTLDCPTDDPKCEACKSSCDRDSLGDCAECLNDCASGLVPLKKCPSTKCYTCADACPSQHTKRDFASATPCQIGCGLLDTEDGHSCRLDADCEACMAACPACDTDTSPDCQHECKTNCVHD